MSSLGVIYRYIGLATGSRTAPMLLLLLLLWPLSWSTIVTLQLYIFSSMREKVPK